MCGRITRNVPRHELDRVFREIKITPSAQELLEVISYNVAPDGQVLAACAAGDGDPTPVLDAARWRLATGWSFESQNAQAEKFLTTYARFNRRRCVVPAGGYYEWCKPPGWTKKDKSPPVYITRADGAPILFAGLWALNSDGVRTCATLTAEPDPTGPLRQLHHRTVVILEPEDVATWLDPDADPRDLQPLLHEPAAGVLRWHSVRPLKGDGPQLVEPV